MITRKVPQNILPALTVLAFVICSCQRMPVRHQESTAMLDSRRVAALNLLRNKINGCDHKRLIESCLEGLLKP